MSGRGTEDESLTTDAHDRAAEAFADLALSRFGDKIAELRKQADYGYGTIDDNVNSLLSKTQQFVSELEDLCPTSD